MKEEYRVDEFGVYSQINPQPFDYTQEYQDKYKNYREDEMSSLRLGYIIGAIGAIPDSLVDVGPGSGAFALNASKIIKSVKINDTIKRDDIALEWTDEPFSEPCEVLTMFDVMEHIEDLSFVERIRARYVVLSVPCFPGIDKFENWKHRRPDEHIHHFDEDSLVKFMASKGWRCFGVTNIEDIIRTSEENNPNIITACFFRF
jgi:hypothetical protein